MRPALTLAAGALVAFTTPALGAQGIVDNPLQHAPTHEVIVRFDPGTPVSERSEAIQSVDAVAQRGLTGLPRAHEVTLPAGEPVADALAELRARPDVAWAVPNGRSRLLATPNDPMYASLWGMPDIGAPTAWDATQGSADVLVGVVDSGIDPGHPDLAANVRADLGRNFVSEGGTVDPSAWDDEVGHGTHVAGTIGAVGNNGLGVTGVNWRVGMIPARAFDMWGGAEDSWVVDGLAYAAARSRVVNASFESGNAAAIDAVIAQYPDTLFVAAAGNSTVDVDSTPVYPCAINRPNVICVAALSPGNGLAAYSNYGAQSVDIGAPGSDVQSTYVPLTTIRDDSSAASLALWSQAPAGFWAAATATDGTPYRVTSGTLNTSPATFQGPVLPALTGTACRFSYNAAFTLPAGVTYRAEASTDGVTWTLLDRAYGNGLTTGGLFYPFSTSLEAFDGQSNVRIRFRLTQGAASTYSVPTRYLAISSPSVECLAAQPAGGAYGALSGTSMAAPQVSGVAALLLAKKPSLTVAELRSALLSSVTPTAALAGRTVTGGRVNAAAAMAVVSPAAVAAEPIALPKAGEIAPMALRINSGKPLRLVVKKGAVKVPVECTGAAAADCRMSVALRHGVKRTKAPRIMWRVMAAKAVTLKAGSRTVVTLALNAYGKKLVVDGASVSAQVRTTPASGVTGDTRSVNARVVAPAKAVSRAR